MSTIQERVKRLIEYLEMNQASFAKSIDTHQSVLSRALKEGQTFGDALINKILLAYDNVSRDWLIDGKGGILKTGDISIKGDSNVANTGIMGEEQNNKKKKAVELLIRNATGKDIKSINDLTVDELIESLFYTIDEQKREIEQLKKDKAILQEFVTFLQNKK